MMRIPRIFSLPLLLLTVPLLSDCGGTAAQIAEEAMVELATTQALASYHQVSVDLTVNGNSAALTCEGGGSVDFGETTNDGMGCYQSQLRQCEISGQRGTLTLTGHSILCAVDGEIPPPEENDAGVNALAGKELTLTGQITAQGEKTQARTCAYDLTFSNIAVDTTSSQNGTEVAVTLDVTGKLCNRQIDLAIDFSIAGQVEVESGS
ncbi:MAG: hypothetical protein D6795_21355 [Deltaproteobacteria bacterium]|nr:MAG: hypothetical protein D6795_21355 [Deltaproteobacteria bacterium]